MLYTGYIHLADDVTYIWMYCTYYHKSTMTHEHHSPLTVDFSSYRLFSRFSCLAALEAAYLELPRQNRHVPP